MNSLSTKSMRSPRKKIALITVVIVAAILAGALVYAYTAKRWPFPSSSSAADKGINYAPPTDAQSNATGSTKQNSSSTETTGSDPSPNPTPAANAGQKPSVNMTVTAANQSSGTLYIRMLIETISSTGTCTLSMTGPNSRTYNATSGVQAGPSTSTCQGFNVPVSSLVSGQWHAVINYADSSVQASASKDITVQ